jgi:hypothetical protein
MPDESLVTEDDVALLNRAWVERTAWLARLAGNVMIGVGAVLAVAWAWVTIRTQQQLSGNVFNDSSIEPSPGIVDRIDAFTGSIYLLSICALVVGLGFLTRLAADYCQTRVGGSVSRFVVGDVLPLDDLSSEED